MQTDTPRLRRAFVPLAAAVTGAMVLVAVTACADRPAGDRSSRLGAGSAQSQQPEKYSPRPPYRDGGGMR